MKSVILIGLPGSGKGTQSKKIAAEFGYEHISTGDIIREEQKNNTAIGNLATRMADNGNLLPDDIVISLVKQRVIDSKNDVGFVFDGFPRTIEQAKSLDVFLYNRKTSINSVINLIISDLTIQERIQLRLIEEGRADDKNEFISVRITNYKNQTAPVLKYFRNRNINLISEINAEREIEDVFSDICKKI